MYKVKYKWSGKIEEITEEVQHTYEFNTQISRINVHETNMNQWIDILMF